MGDVIPRHQAIVNLPERHRMPGGQLLAGSFPDSFNLGVGSPVPLYLSCHLNPRPTIRGQDTPKDTLARAVAEMLTTLHGSTPPAT